MDKVELSSCLQTTRVLDLFETIKALSVIPFCNNLDGPSRSNLVQPDVLNRRTFSTRLTLIFHTLIATQVLSQPYTVCIY